MHLARPVLFLPLLIVLLLLMGFLLLGFVLLGSDARRHVSSGNAFVPNGPRGVVVPAVLDLGRLAADAQRAVELPWHRQGAGPLRVLDVRTDCGCAVVTPLAEVLAQGAGGRLPVRIRVGSRPGPFGVRVRIVTDGDPPADVATCRLRGYVDLPLGAYPPALALGRRSPGAALERSVELRWHDDTADIEVHPHLRGVDGNVAVGPSAFRNRPGALLTVQLHAPTDPGRFRAHLTVEVTGVGELLVPITGEVVAEGR